MKNKLLIIGLFLPLFAFANVLDSLVFFILVPGFFLML